MMRVWLAVFVLAAMTYSVTPCCFPNEFFLDFDIGVINRWSYDGKDYNYTTSLYGNVSVDIKAQKFRTTIGIPAGRGGQIQFVEYLLDLKKTPGVVTIKERMCMEGVTYGQVGKEWRCVLDNKNIFTKKGRIYDVNILGFITGTVEVSKDTCLPVYVEVTINSPSPRRNDVTEATFVGYNLAEKVHARSDLDKPCDAPPPADNDENDPYSYRPTVPTIQIMTPDQLLEQLRLMVERERNMGTTPPPQPYTTWIPEYFTTESPLESEEVIDEAGQQGNGGSGSEEDDEDRK